MHVINTCPPTPVELLPVFTASVNGMEPGYDTTDYHVWVQDY